MKEEKYDQEHKDSQGTERKHKPRRDSQERVGRPALKKANNNSRPQNVRLALERRQLVETKLACSH